MRFCRFASLAFLMFLLPCAAATAVERGEQTLRFGEGLPYEVLIDPGATLGIEEVQQSPGGFVPMAGPVNLGYTRSAVWLRFTVPADWHRGSDLWLEIRPIYLDTVQLYYKDDPRPQAPWRVKTAGDAPRSRGEALAPGRPVFRIAPDQRGEVYLRVETSSTLVIVGSIHTPEGYAYQLRSKQLLQGGQLGATLALVLLFLLVGVSLKDRQMTVYAIAGCVISLQQSATQGVFFDLLVQVHPGAAHASVGVMTAWSLGAMIWVIREMVVLGRSHTLLGHLLAGMSAMAAVAPLSIPLDLYGPVIAVAHLSVLLAFGLAVPVLIRRSGGRWGPYGVLALVMGAVFAGTAVIVAALVGWSSLRGWGLVLWGSMGQVVLVLFGVVLAARNFSKLKRVQLRIRRRLVKVRSVSRRLEQQVAERTRDLQRSEARLRHALDAERSLRLDQRQFFAMISHEFRTPLAVIDMAAHMQQRYPTPDLLEQRARAARMRRASARLRTLVDNCLVDERLATGGFRLEVRSVRVADLVRGASELVGLTGQHRLEIDVSEAPQGWQCDPTLVRIAISNLVDNAVKYSGQGTIRVAVTRQAQALCITVSDDGPGIRPEDRAKVFAAFDRGGRSDEGSGYGFGLYVTRRVARLHGGDASLDADAPAGTVFRLTLAAQPQPGG